MRLPRTIPVLLLAGMMLMSGCKKKAKVTPPPPAQAPTITEPEKPPTQPTQPPVEATPPATTEAGKPTIATPKPKPPTKPAPKKPAPAPAPQPATQPNKTVVPEGGAGEPGQLSAAIPKTEAIQKRMNTAQLLEASEANLKSITRQLSTDEQAIVQQIRSYMQQSRSATTEGDTQRAYNLADKAHQLSVE